MCIYGLFFEVFNELFAINAIRIRLQPFNINIARISATFRPKIVVCYLVGAVFFDFAYSWDFKVLLTQITFYHTLLFQNCLTFLLKLCDLGIVLEILFWANLR